MKIVKGNKILDFSGEKLKELSSKFRNVAIDLGTGDGNYVYGEALKNPDTLYIGIDPSAKQMQVFSKKALRKKLENILFVIGSIEVFPNDFDIKADKVTVNFPWGSLMEKIVRCEDDTVLFFKKLLKPGGKLEFIFGYSEDLEPTETSRLELPEINEGYVEQNIIPKFEKSGFKLTGFAQLSHEEIKNTQTTWSKKLAFNKERVWFRLSFSL